MQVDRDLDTGSSVLKTKGRKLNTGTRSHSKVPQAATRRTRLPKTFPQTKAHPQAQMRLSHLNNG